ncbi:MAG: ABC transporter permease [gamma proteobacterium symbiont of Ctena orbiculata]|uniref:ABC transporter permease n=1 Tax=Candidatus Thiodiazotropha taylori TaxID=2792791 RepID=A0A944M9H5_9GAMM|nr:ABC transporter permease [Candidatus Thiodiazotropha taylori]PVV10577.1 MAG: ABC transporter permease [gamma proteobacterium symbiont of Ctena orbiculata]MBT2989789.1 ABC transporter permease [Candidatus Thiodiazotropha taylori]MBT2995497.1 ABC transporter permease [Candidatus Thiodiazotropha taylori]MBV2106641.1 ABC transporter permease [Candidatus Thiodiazotropha taylori]
MNQSTSTVINTILTVALRNLLAHRRRTFLTIGAIAVGLASLIFLWGFNEGLHRNMLGNFQDAIIGSIQIHHQGFFQHPELSKAIANPQKVVEALRQADVSRYSMRLESFGLAASDITTQGVMLIGMDPLREGEVTQLGKRIGIGRFLAPEDEYTLILGATTANNLQVKLGDEVIIIGYDRFGAMLAESFTLIGIITSGEMGLDKGMAITTLATLQEMVDMTDRITTVVISSEEKRVPSLTAELEAALQGDELEVMPWYSMFPVMKEWVTLHNGFLYLFLGVVLFIVLAGELNTMLISMLERTREFGVLMAIGTTGYQIAGILLVEAVVIGIVGILSGILLGYVIVLFSSNYGIDLSILLGSTSRFYVDPLIYPHLKLDHLGITSGVILIASIFAGLYPAWRASMLQPVEAIRNG